MRLRAWSVETALRAKGELCLAKLAIGYLFADVRLRLGCDARVGGVGGNQCTLQLLSHRLHGLGCLERLHPNGCASRALRICGALGGEGGATRASMLDSESEPVLRVHVRRVHRPPFELVNGCLQDKRDGVVCNKVNAVRWAIGHDVEACEQRGCASKRGAGVAILAVDSNSIAPVELAQKVALHLDDAAGCETAREVLTVNPLHQSDGVRRWGEKAPNRLEYGGALGRDLSSRQITDDIPQCATIR